MQTQARQQYRQRGRGARTAIVVSCGAVIAILVTWAPSLIGSANHDPGLLSAGTSRANGAENAVAEPAKGSSKRRIRPTCAELGGIASMRDAEEIGDGGSTVGCGVGGNLAGDTPAGNRNEPGVDVATLLAWHVHGRDLLQYARQTTSSDALWTEATVVHSR